MTNLINLGSDSADKW